MAPASQHLTHPLVQVDILSHVLNDGDWPICRLQTMTDVFVAANIHTDPATKCMYLLTPEGISLQHDQLIFKLPAVLANHGLILKEGNAMHKRSASSDFVLHCFRIFED